MPAYDAFFSHVVVSHNVQIGNVKLIDETTGRISNNLVSIADVNNATLNAFADGQLSNIDDAISLINLKLGDVQKLWEPVYYPNDNQITIMNLTSYLRNLHNEIVTIQSNTDLTPLVSNIDINRERLSNLQGNVTDLKSIVLGKDGNDTTTTPGLVNRVGLLEAAVGNIQMDVDLTPLVSNIDINREQLGNLQGNVTDLKSIVLGKDGNDTTTTPGLVWDVQTLQTNFKNLESTIEGNYITNTPGLVWDVQTLQSNVTTLEAVVGNIQMDVDLTPLVSNIDINRERLGNLQTKFTKLESTVVGNSTTDTPGLVWDVHILQGNVTTLEAVVGNIQMDVDLTPLVSNIDINRERLSNLQGNVTDLKSIVLGKDGNDTTTTPGLVNRVGLLEAAVGNIQMDVDLTPLVSNIDINREQLGNLQGNVTDLKSIVLGKDGNDTTTTPGLVWDVQTLQTNFKNLESTIEGNYITNTPGLVWDVQTLQSNVTTLEAVVGNIQMDVDLTPLVSNIDINRERLDNLRGNVTNLESVVLPGLVGNVTALQSSVTDIRGDNPDSSINLSLLYGIILDLQSKVNVLKDPFSVQVVSSTTTEIKMRLQGRSLGDITVNIGGQIFKIINYDGNYELLVTGLQPTTIYDVTVNFENLSFTYDIQMTTI